MRNLIILAAFLTAGIGSLLLTSSNNADARLSPQDVAQVSDSHNLLTNPGFEGNITDWINTGGVLTTVSTNPLFGSASGVWTASANGNSLQSKFVSVPTGMLGRTCSLEFDYIWPGTVGNLEVQIKDPTETLHTIELQPSTVSAPFQFFFTCPDVAGSQINMEIVATNAAAQLSIDNVFLGTGKSLGGSISEVFQTKYLNSDVTAVTTDIPDLNFSNLTVGKKYRMHLFASLDFQSNTEAKDAGILAKNGSVDLCTVQFTIRQNSGTLDEGDLRAGCTKVFTATSSSLTVGAVGNYQGAAKSTLTGNGTGTGTYIQLEELVSGPSLNLETSGSLLTARHETDCVFNKPSSAFGQFNTDSSCSFSVDKVIGFKNISSLDNSGNLPGLNLDFPYKGDFKICANYSLFTGSRIQTALMFNAAQISGHEVTSSSGADSGSLCGIARVESLSGNTIEIFGKSTTGTSIIGPHSSATSLNRTIEWIITPVNTFGPQVVFNDIQDALNSRPVSLGTNGAALVTKSVRFACQPTCTIINEQGDWVDSITKTATGRYTLNMNAGMFGGLDDYYCNIQPGGVNQTTGTYGNLISVLPGNFSVLVENSSGAEADVVVWVVCTGSLN